MVRIASVASVLAFLALSASLVAAQESPKSETPTVAAMDLDASPTAEKPDPLAPAEVVNQPLLAPGAQPPATVATTPTQANPIVAAVRQHLGDVPASHHDKDNSDHQGLIAFYEAPSNGQPLWVTQDGFTPRATQVITELRAADDWGLKSASFDLPTFPQGLPAPPTPEQLADLEIKVSQAVLTYARHARGGRFDPPSLSHIFDQKPRLYEPRSVLDGIAASDAADAYLRKLHPQHPQFEKLRQALLAARKEATPATADASVASPKAPRHASSEDIKRLLINMERWRWMPDQLGDIYVWDSIPDQTTQVFENGKSVLTEKIVVGKTSSPTPIFSADMLFIIFHPEWGVPDGIKSQELAPQLRHASAENKANWLFGGGETPADVLHAHDLRISLNGQSVDPNKIDWESADIGQFQFSQPPGAKNVLGNVKFRFPNRHDVYMHDTPERNLFGGNVRAFSHGCMRVQNPIHLAQVLLTHDKGWDADKVRQVSNHGEEIKLTHPIPVHITYFTAWVDDAGTVQYKPDIYGLDDRMGSAMEGRAVRLASKPAPGPALTAARSLQRSPAQLAARPPRRNQRQAMQPVDTNPFAALFGN